MSDRPWLAGIALALMGSLLLPAVWDIAVFRWLFCGFIAVGLGGAALSFVVSLRRRRDPYDLEALREMHERAEVQKLLEEEPEAQGDTILCRSCGACYPAAYSVCPECGHAAGT